MATCINPLRGNDCEKSRQTERICLRFSQLLASQGLGTSHPYESLNCVATNARESDEWDVSLRLLNQVMIQPSLLPQLSDYLWRPASIPCAATIVKSLDRPKESACVFHNSWHPKVLMQAGKHDQHDQQQLRCD